MANVVAEFETPRVLQLREEIRALEGSILTDRLAWMARRGHGVGAMERLWTTLGYPESVSVAEYRRMYERGGVAEAVVEAFPKATWRGELKIYEDEDPEKDTDFELAVQALDDQLCLWETLFKADILSQLGFYSVVVIGAPGDDLSQELPKGKPGDLLYLKPYLGGGIDYRPSRRVISTVNDPDADISIKAYGTNPRDPRFGLPMTYALQIKGVAKMEVAMDLHWTRVLHVADGTLDNSVFGKPCLQSVFNLLLALEKVTGGGAEAFWLRANQGLVANSKPDATGGGLTEAELVDLKRQMEDYHDNMRRVLLGENVDISALGSDVANFSNPADAILTQIAGTKRIPKRILMGSEMGQLASGQDADNFSTQVKDRRTQYAWPRMVRPGIQRLIDYGYLPKPAQFRMQWDEVDAMGLDDKVSVAVKMAVTNKTQGEIVFTNEEIRENSLGLKPLDEDQKKPVGAPVHVSETGAAPPADAFPRAAEFNADQPRDEHGQWASDGGPQRDFSQHTPEDGYLYHATNLENAIDISSGSLRTFGPSHGTDQDSWPDGSQERRSYWTAGGGKVASSFAPEGGRPVLLRVPTSKVQAKRESTGDVYLRKSVPAAHLEILHSSGKWLPLARHQVRAAEEAELARVLQAAIEAGNWEVVHEITGETFHALGNEEQPRDDHGRWVAGGSSGIAHEYHPHGSDAAKSRTPSAPDEAKNEHVDYKGRPVANGQKYAFNNLNASQRMSNDLRVKGWNVVAKFKPGSFGSTGATLHPFKVTVDGRLVRK